MPASEAVSPVLPSEAAEQEVPSPPGDCRPVEQEMLIATEIQKNFLPAELPARSDLAFAAQYRPAMDAGGDFYDVYQVGPDELYFVIGDVAGKGVPAALLMAQSLSMLRLMSLAPGEWLTFYNDGLTDSRDSSDGGAQLGSAGARRMLENPFANPQYVVATLSHVEASHRGDSPRQDDLALLAFGFHA